MQKKQINSEVLADKFGQQGGKKKKTAGGGGVKIKIGKEHKLPETILPKTTKLRLNFTQTKLYRNLLLLKI